MEPGKHLLLYALRSHGDYSKPPSQWRYVGISIAGDMSHSDIAAAASTWGYGFTGTVNRGMSLSFRRQDAQGLDIVGGPARSIVRDIEKARDEAEAVKAETGHDVLDPDWYLPLEASAGACLKKRNRWLAWIVVGGFATFLFAMGAIFNDAYIFVILALLSWAGLIFAISRKVAASKKFDREFRPNIDLLRRVLNVAEEELLAAVE